MELNYKKVRLKSRQLRAKKYSESRIRDSEYGFLGNAGNLILGAGSLLGIGAAKRKIRKNVINKGVNSAISGTSAVAAKAMGIDKESAEQLIGGLADATGARKALKQGFGGPTRDSLLKRARVNIANKTRQLIGSSGTPNTNVGDAAQD